MRIRRGGERGARRLTWEPEYGSAAADTTTSYVPTTGWATYTCSLTLTLSGAAPPLPWYDRGPAAPLGATTRRFKSLISALPVVDTFWAEQRRKRRAAEGRTVTVTGTRAGQGLEGASCAGPGRGPAPRVRA